MPAKSRSILLIGLVASLAGLFIFLLSQRNPTEEHGIWRKEPDPNAGHPTDTAEPTDDEALSSKSKPRSPTPEVSKAKTLALLKTPIPGPVEFPEQTLAERVTAINQWLERAGVPGHQLRVAVEARSAPRNLNLLLEPFAVEDETPSTVLKYTAGSTRLYFIVHAGLAEFAEVSLPPTRPDQPAAEAPATE
jgi:hypothetical protein